VNRMGGVQAWRDSEKAKFERGGGFAGKEEEVDGDADCEFDSEGEELPEEEVEWRKKQKRKARREAEDAADVGDETGVDVEDGGGAKMVWMEQGAEDDVSSYCAPDVRSTQIRMLMALQSFTMDMMLRSLNIELEVIGYEKEAQRWTT